MCVVWCQVLITAEMPLSGGFYVSHSVDTIRLHPYVESHQLFYLVVQLVFFVFTIVFVMRVLRDVMTMGAAFYSTVRCWLDLCLAASSLFLVIMFIDYSVTLYDSSEHVDEMRYRRLFHANRLLLAADAFVGLFVIVRVLLLCRYVPVMSRVFDVMDKSSPYVVSSVVVGLLVWLMMSVSAAALFRHDVLQLRSVGASMSSMLYAIARLYHYGSLLSAGFFIALTVLFFVCVARAVCAVAMLASFHDLAQLPDSEDTRLYFGQLAHNFRDAIGCVNVSFRRKKTTKPTAVII